MADQSRRRPVRIGLVATDPLRILGLQEMFPRQANGGTGEPEIIPLSVPGVLQEASLSNVLIDASCTDRLMELLTMFHRVRPQVRLLVIGDSKDGEYIQRIIGAGARGYVTHAVTGSELRMALDMVNDGSVWAPRRVLARLLDATSQFGLPIAPKVDFTRREVDILQLLVEGLANREIAVRLAISEGAVKGHVSRLIRKVRVSNRVELTLYILPRVTRILLEAKVDR